MPELRPEWVCEECAVRCYKATGEPFPRPTGWKGDRCMTCSQDSETPLDSARRQVLEGKVNSRIMVRGVKGKTLDQMREEAIEAGELDPDAVRKPKQVRDPDRIRRVDEAMVPAVEEALRADPARTNSALAEEFGVNAKTVAITRKRLGVPDAINAQKQANDARIEQELREHPDLNDHEIAERLGMAKGTIGGRRRKLGIPGKKPHSTVGST
jgi:hypothetical protein